MKKASTHHEGVEARFPAAGAEGSALRDRRLDVDGGLRVLGQIGQESLQAWTATDGLPRSTQSARSSLFTPASLARIVVENTTVRPALEIAAAGGRLLAGHAVPLGAIDVAGSLPRGREEKEGGGEEQEGGTKNLDHGA
jgi:hypothetical protein